MLGKGERRVKINFVGGVGQVTGSNFLLQYQEHKILVDCGLFQEAADSREKNKKPFSYNPKEVELLFITHAHLDHIGRIPQLVASGFNGKIISTAETKEIAKLILEDAFAIASRRTKEGKELLYSETDLKKAFTLWQSIPYGEPYSIDSSLQAVFKNSGHILGSAMVEFIFKDSKERALFTGDLGNWPNPLLQKRSDGEGVTHLIIESVYGNRNHTPLAEGKLVFQNMIEKVIAQKGVLLVPTFSLERAQVILYELNKMVESKAVPQIPVFLDSPLAIKLLDIYKKSTHLLGAEAQKLIQEGDDIFSFPNLVISRSPFESKAIKEYQSPKIIIAGSGMSEGGRIIFHEAEYLPDKNNILLLTGYQAVGTLGRALEEGMKTVEIMGKQIEVNAHIEHTDSFSGHLGLDGLLEFVETCGESLKQVFVVMGEPKASFFLAQRIKDYLDVPAIVPEANKEYNISL